MKHGEIDLGVAVVAGPGSREVYGPVEAGEAERRPVYQLWPALTRLRLFGAGYRPRVARLLGAADQA